MKIGLYLKALSISFLLLSTFYAQDKVHGENKNVQTLLPHRVALVPPIARFHSKLSIGDGGEEVRNLQRFLNQHGFLVEKPGLNIDGLPHAGSPGHESDYFGEKTKNALMRYQEAYGAYVLAPAGLGRASGIFGEHSIVHANSLLEYKFVNLFPVERSMMPDTTSLVATVIIQDTLIAPDPHSASTIKSIARDIQKISQQIIDLF
jgi:peptidoglycan hydrolase-like protein with peptidoglycan-binding domain